MKDEIDSDDTMIARRASGAPEASSTLSLVIMSPDGTGHVALPERGTLTLGRSPECEVSLGDPKLSRKHAQIRCGAEIAVVDLESRNGTFLRDQRLTPNVPVVLRVGDSVSLGSSVVVLQRTVAGTVRPRHVWSHGYFEARLEEECATATAETAFAIVRIRLSTMGAARGSASLDAPPSLVTMTDSVSAQPEAPPELVNWLRPTDMVGIYAPNELEVLLTKTSLADAEERTAELGRSLRRAGVEFGMAVAAYPRDGRTPEGLIEHTSRLLRRDVAPGGETSERSLIPMGALERMEPIVSRVAAGSINVLVLGETGVGKEILSRRIHTLSPRASKLLVSLNCAALSESLLESELFGHEKGAFTGALAAKAGLIESADGGTVFLDEIGEMPLSVQAKLLRVIEQREVTRVGALRPRAIDVRFVSATHRDLEREIAGGRFRQDLYFRLNGIALSLPPLRERVEEIEPLAKAFVEQSCRAMQRARVPRIAADALDTLKRYQWPGNIRELRNVMERAVLLCSGELITREHLPIEKLGAVLPASVHMPVALTVRPSRPPPRREEDRENEQDPAVTAEMPIPAELRGEGTAERTEIIQALERCGGNQSQAAKELGMSRQTFIRRLEEYAIPRPRKRE